MSKLEFLEEGHIYIYDGIPIPSVSDIVKFVFPDKYGEVPEHILQEAAKFGTEMHSIVEEYEDHKTRDFYTITQEILLDDYKKLKKENNLEVVKKEQMIHNKDIYAGRYDQLAKQGDKTVLIDLKFTAELDYEWLQLQLSLYNMVVKADKLGCYHIPRNRIQSVRRNQRVRGGRVK